MKTKLLCLFLLSLSLRIFSAPLDTQPASAAPDVLKFDADSKQYAAKLGETVAPFTFIATNVSLIEISITALRTSCGCTVAQLPSMPYKLQPGSNVAINVTMDLRGKQGEVTKSVWVDAGGVTNTLQVRVNVPTENKTETK